MVCHLYIKKYMKSFTLVQSIPELPWVPAWEDRAHSRLLLLKREISTVRALSNTMVLKM